MMNDNGDATMNNSLAASLAGTVKKGGLWVSEKQSAFMTSKGPVITVGHGIRNTIYDYVVDGVGVVEVRKSNKVIWQRPGTVDVPVQEQARMRQLKRERARALREIAARETGLAEGEYNGCESLATEAIARFRATVAECDQKLATI